MMIIIMIIIIIIIYTLTWVSTCGTAGYTCCQNKNLSGVHTVICYSCNNSLILLLQL